MAESLDRGQINNNAVNDDMIKDALKTGLSSIKASDYLVSQTLLKCQNELTKEKQPKLFIPWIYKLGAPLAAGALAIVLLINSNGLRMKNTADNMSPQASSAGIASMQGLDAAKPKEAPAPSLEGAGTTEPQEDISYGTDLADDELVLKFSESITATAKTEISVLYSSVNSDPNVQGNARAEAGQPFNEIAELHNQANETELVLEEAAITRISSLVKTGVSAQMLEETQDYYEILSDEGYWALPLKNGNGDVEKILTVSALSSNPEATVSNKDIIYTIDRKRYVVSELAEGTYIGTTLKELFDKNAIGGIIEKAGFTSGSDIIIADINYGMDFIALADSGDQKLAIPFLINEATLRLENKKVYTWAEFTRIVSGSMKQ